VAIPASYFGSGVNRGIQRLDAQLRRLGANSRLTKRRAAVRTSLHGNLPTLQVKLTAVRLFHLPPLSFQRKASSSAISFTS
jgi:hypothetical protein